MKIANSIPVLLRNHHFLVHAVVVLAMSLPLSMVPANASAADLNSEGIQLYRAGKLKESVEKFEEAIQSADKGSDEMFSAAKNILLPLEKLGDANELWKAKRREVLLLHQYKNKPVPPEYDADSPEQAREKILLSAVAAAEAERNGPQKVRISAITLPANKDKIRIEMRKANPGIRDAELETRVQVIVDKIHSHALELLERCRSGADFKQIAREHLEEADGDMGTWSKKDLPSDLASDLWKLKPGEVLPRLWELDGGFSVMQVREFIRVSDPIQNLTEAYGDLATFYKSVHRYDDLSAVLNKVIALYENDPARQSRLHAKWAKIAEEEGRTNDAAAHRKLSEELATKSAAKFKAEEKNLLAKSGTAKTKEDLLRSKFPLLELYTNHHDYESFVKTMNEMLVLAGSNPKHVQVLHKVWADIAAIEGHEADAAKHQLLAGPLASPNTNKGMPVTGPEYQAIKKLVENDAMEYGQDNPQWRGFRIASTVVSKNASGYQALVNIQYYKVDDVTGYPDRITTKAMITYPIKLNGSAIQIDRKGIDFKIWHSQF